MSEFSGGNFDPADDFLRFLEADFDGGAFPAQALAAWDGAAFTPDLTSRSEDDASVLGDESITEVEALESAEQVDFYDLFDTVSRNLTEMPGSVLPAFQDSVVIPLVPISNNAYPEYTYVNYKDWQGGEVVCGLASDGKTLASVTITAKAGDQNAESREILTFHPTVDSKGIDFMYDREGHNAVWDFELPSLVRDEYGRAVEDEYGYKHQIPKFDLLYLQDVIINSFRHARNPGNQAA